METDRIVAAILAAAQAQQGSDQSVEAYVTAYHAMLGALKPPESPSRPSRIAPIYGGAQVGVERDTPRL